MGVLEDFKRTYKTLAYTTIHLIKKVPEGKEDFKPPVGEFVTLGQLLYHLGDAQMFLRMIFEGTMRELDRNFLEYMGKHFSAVPGGLDYPHEAAASRPNQTDYRRAISFG